MLGLFSAFSFRFPSTTTRAWAALVALSILATNAQAQAPTQIPFQGLLLDAGGTPVNAAVDLDFELFDALLLGTSLWSESHLGVIVVDGVYSVNLGSTTPMTQLILSGGSAFLEITVGGETLVPRQQLLSVPYALIAESARVAENVGGAPAIFVEQLLASFNFDGQEPGNLHPDEGYGDTDGDGIPNFIDPDNDNDGVSDGDELLLGSSINLATPRISAVAPVPIQTFAPTTLVVTGTGMATVSSVSFGAETPIPSSVTPTSFEIDVVAETLATQATVAITLSNGETASWDVSLQAVAPTISTPPFAVLSDQVNEVNITGTGFYPGMIVRIGDQTLIPSALTESSLTVTMAPEPQGPLTLEVVHPNTLSASITIFATTIGGSLTRTVFLSTAGQPAVSFGGLAVADAQCQSEADAAGLPLGFYRAWMSDDSGSPATTFNQIVGPYVLPDGSVVAGSWADLTDGSLLAPISMTASGLTAEGILTWTGTRDDGTAATNHCGNWDSNAAAASGQTGLSSETSDWTARLNLSCMISARYYCFQQ